MKLTHLTSLSTVASKACSTLLPIGVLAGGIALSAPANAGTFSACTGPGYDISNKVTGTSDCTISDDFNQDFLNTDPMTVNIGPGFFNMTDWIFGGKIGDDASDGYLGNGSGQSGSWDISTVNNVGNWGDTMLVFKSGRGTTLTGYMLQDGITAGTWDTPFVEPPFDFPGNNPKDVSHISVYYKEGGMTPTPIPEPAAVGALFVLGGLTISRRRKSGKVS